VTSIVPSSATARGRPAGNGRLASPTSVGSGDGARPPAEASPSLGWAALLVAVALAVSPLATGYFDFGLWGPLAIGAMVLLVIIAWAARPSFTRQGLAASGGLLILLALSSASMLWAESKESAWTAVNRISLYAVVFAIVLLTVRDRRNGRRVMLILGGAALLVSLVLCVSLLLGGSEGAFLQRRLNSPIGYINGTAGLLVMGIWPWIAYAETAPRRIARAAALAGASLIAGMVVLTQSRAVLPAAVLSAALVLLCAPERTRRAVNLIVTCVSVAVGLHWTLAVYSSGGAAGRSLAPTAGVLRPAAAAILLSALGAGAIRFALSSLAARLDSARRQRVVRQLGRSLALATVLLVTVGSIVGGPWLARQYRSFTSLKVNQNVSTRFTDASGFRYDLWSIAAHEFSAHPFGGVGAGNYDRQYYLLRRNPQYVVQPHSLELQMAAELGIGGIAALLLFCGAIIWSGFARRATLASEDRLIKVAALGMFVAWLADTSVDWLYDIPGLAGMALVAAALLVVPAAPRAGHGRRSRRGQGAFVIGLCVLGLLAASVGRQYAGTRYANAGANQVGQAPYEAIRTLQQARRLDPYSLSTLYSLASSYSQVDDYVRARDALLVAARLEPHNYVPPSLLGDLAMRRGDYSLAVAEYRRALGLNPHDPVVQQSELAAEASAR
jgi:O-Antigen ligase